MLGSAQQLQLLENQNGRLSSGYFGVTHPFVEAANFARRYDEHCRRWYDRKAAKTSKVIATKALGCKLAKVAWHVMAQQCSYDEKRMFPELAMKKN